MNLTRDTNNLLMQPRELSKAISYLSKSVSKNSRSQTKVLTQRFICWSLESSTRDPYVSGDEAWVAHQEQTPSWVSFNRFSHSTKLLLLSLRRWIRPSQTFSWLTTTVGSLGRRLAIYEASPPRVTNVTKIASQSSSAQMTRKEDSLNPNLEFSQIT
jgi:hypothetical protein